MRKITLLVGCMAMALALAPDAASACRRCGFKLDCQISPDCEIVPACKGTQFPTRGYVGCEASGSSCDTWGELCDWADNRLQREEADLLAIFTAQNLSSELRVVLSSQLTGGPPRPPRPVALPQSRPARPEYTVQSP